MKKVNWFMSSWFIGGLWLAGCASSDMKPVDLYPEDQCAQCRMAVSSDSFASEIITKNGEVFKFDDLGCQEKFVKDYQTRIWLLKEKSFIVLTSIKTPMGSGKVAVADSIQAKQLVEKYPAQDISEADGCPCCKVNEEQMKE